MVTDIFSEVLSDNFSGSGQILLSVQQALMRYGQEVENPDLPALMIQLDKLEYHFPHFALLFHFLNKLRMFVRKNPSAKGEKLTAFVKEYQYRWENTQTKVSENVLKSLTLSNKNILLHSNSSAIHNLFRIMADRKIFPTIWQTVSSPANEGFIQAGLLKNMGFDVHVFHEDAVSKFITKLDLAVFGADLLWKNSFLNKVGAFPISLIFNHFHKPVYVLAESRKKIDTAKINKERWKRFLSEQPKPATELSENSVRGLSIHNYYFEAVPLSFVHQVFVE